VKIAKNSLALSAHRDAADSHEIETGEVVKTGVE
jgi:hypothetical protein